MKLIDVHNDRKVAIDFLYELMKERDPEVNISTQGVPTIQQHRKYVVRHPYRFWYLIEHDGEYVGAISATQRNEIGIAILRRYRRKGYGRQAIEEVFRIKKPLPAISGLRNASWVANINPENTKSISFFESVGFRHLSKTYVKDE